MIKRLELIIANVNVEIVQRIPGVELDIILTLGEDRITLFCQQSDALELIGALLPFTATLKQITPNE